MKLSVWVFLSDLLPNKKTVFERYVIEKFIRKSVFSKNNLFDILTSLKKSGVDGIELAVSPNVTSDDIQKAKPLLKETDMSVLSIHQSLTQFFGISIKHVKKLCKIANCFGAKVIVLHANVIGRKLFDKKYIYSLKALEKLYDVKISIENSPLSFLTIFKTYSWKEKEFSELMEHRGLNITFDTTHLAQTAKEIISFYKKNKDKIINIHLSDYKINLINRMLLLANDTHLPLGKGELPIEEFLQVLNEDSYNGLITMEINGTLEELCESARFVKNSVDKIIQL